MKYKLDELKKTGDSVSFVFPDEGLPGAANRIGAQAYTYAKRHGFKVSVVMERHPKGKKGKIVVTRVANRTEGK